MGLLYSPATQAAMALIKPYVERGDSLQSIRSSYMGTYWPNGMAASVGGRLKGKAYSYDYIAVERDINGLECNEAFKLTDIYRLCQRKQVSLF